MWFIENTGLHFFFALNETGVHTYFFGKSMNRELPFVVCAKFLCGRKKKFAILVNRIFPTLLAA